MAFSVLWKLWLYVYLYMEVVREMPKSITIVFARIFFDIILLRAYVKKIV